MTKPTPAELEVQVKAAWERSISHPQDNLAALQALLPAVQASGDRRLQALTLTTLGRSAFYLSDYQGLLTYNEAALTSLGELDEPALRARIHNSLGVAQQEFQHFVEALEHYLAAAREWERDGDVSGMVAAMTNLAICHYRLANYPQALEMQQHVLKLAEKHGMAHPIASGQANLMQIYNALGQHERVLELLPDTQRRVQALKILDWEAEVIREEAVALRGLGRWPEAEAALQRALKLCDQKGTERAARIQRGELLLELGRALLPQGRLNEAEQVIEASLALARKHQRPEVLRGLYELMIELHQQRQELDLALQRSRDLRGIERKLAAQRIAERSRGLLAQEQLRALQREAELERQRNAALEEKNRALLEAQTLLTHQATHDGLTGIANRAHFIHCVQDTLDTLPPGEHAALLFVDLDQFKAVNDLFTHAIGDELLRQVAARLRNFVKSPDLAGRVGGDEFNVLLHRVASREAALAVAQGLLEVLRTPYDLQGRSLEATASIGVALSPEDGTDASILQGHADLAMFSIKHARRNDVLMYSPEIKLEHERRLSLEHDLRSALARGELHLYYQGRFTVQEQRLVGFEALLRWFHPQYGLITPKTFIPLAEHSGLILSIGAWVLQEACRQAATWEFERRGMSISVNVSPLQFEQPDFAEQIREVLAGVGLPGQCLVLELTETLVLRDMQRAQQHIQQVQALGVRVAIDDFGTGYSSLSVLHDLPFDQLKIDQTFIHRIQDNVNPPVTSGVLMDGMVNLAHDLTMQVTAEGLENQQQLLYLRDLNCDFAQGYFLGVPQPAAEAEKLLNLS